MAYEGFSLPIDYETGRVELIFHPIDAMYALLPHEKYRDMTLEEVIFFKQAIESYERDDDAAPEVKVQMHAKILFFIANYLSHLAADNSKDDSGDDLEDCWVACKTMLAKTNLEKYFNFIINFIGLAPSLPQELVDIYMLALNLLQQFCQEKNTTLTCVNIQKYFTTAFIIAFKFQSDLRVLISNFSLCYQSFGQTTTEMNELELEFLVTINWNIKHINTVADISSETKTAWETFSDCSRQQTNQELQPNIPALLLKSRDEYYKQKANLKKDKEGRQYLTPSPSGPPHETPFLGFFSHNRR